MIDAKYRSETGKIYELHDEGWYLGEQKFPDAVFLSSKGAALQYEMLKNRIITLEEFFEKDDQDDEGYLYYIIMNQGKRLVRHSSKLTEIGTDTIKFAEE